MSGRGSRLTAVLAGVGAIALVLGFIGYRHFDGVDLEDALYQSIQLFFLDYRSEDAGDPSDALEVARYLAAIVAVFTVLAVVYTLLREPFQRLRIRAWRRPHTVVIGLGGRGARITRRLRGTGPIVVVERERGGGQASGIGGRGVAVVYGDARNQGVLEAVHATRASDVVIVAGDDTTSLELLASCHRVLDGVSPAPRTLVHVAIDDLALWRQFHRLSLARRQARPRTEFLSLPDRVAESLVSAACETLPGSHGRDHVLVQGAGPVAVRVVVHAVRRSLLAGNTVKVTLAGPEAESVYAQLEALEEWVSRTAIVEWQVRPTAEMSTGPPTAAFVCGLVEAEALAVGAELSHQLARHDALVYVAVPDEDTSEALAATSFELPALRLVAAESEVIGQQLLRDAALELIAIAKHDDYVLQEQKRGVTRAENASVIPWIDLPQSLQESNRRFAESIGAKLGQLDATLAPLAGPPPNDGLALSAGRLEELAEHEHERWVKDLTDDKWSRTDGQKDPGAKRHPLLIPWKDLPDSEREKDREAIRALPKILATVGYQVEIPD